VSTAEALALIASFVAGLVFMVLAARPVRHAPKQQIEKTLEPDIFWPLLLGTGERDFSPEMRLSIARELLKRGDDWSLAILRCAREHEMDPRVLEVIDRALERITKPVLGPPPGWSA
jgi:hypothetical protein